MRWRLGLLSVLAAVPFLSGVTATLIHYDDSIYIYQNTKVLGKPGLAGLLGVWDGARAWAGDYVEFFPLRDTVYWLVYQKYGIDGWPYHLCSLAFHVSATLLAYLFLRKLTSEWVALVAAGLFAVHPIHIESVLWAAGLKDPMYTTFVFASCIAYLRYKDRQRPVDYLVMMLSLLCAFLVKSMALPTALMFVVLERTVGPKTPWLEIAKRSVGPVLMSGLFFFQYMCIGKAANNLVPPHGGNWGSHTILALWAQAKYLKQAFVPSSFRLIYCFAQPTGWGDYRLWVGLACVLGLFISLYLVRKSGLLFLAISWYIAYLVTVSNIISFPALMADRYLYASVFGICIVIAVGFARLEKFRLLLACATIGVLATTTFMRSFVWHDEAQLWEEPDADPECTQDTSFPAAQSHLLRSWTAPTAEERLMAIERALITPGLAYTGPRIFCDILIQGCTEAVAVGVPERADAWAVLAMKNCQSEAETWNVVTMVNMHRKLAVASKAAAWAFRLRPSPKTKALVAVTRFEAGDITQPAEINRIVHKAPRACPVVVTWASEVPTLAPQIAEAVEFCLAQPKSATEEQ